MKNNSIVLFFIVTFNFLYSEEIRLIESIKVSKNALIVKPCKELSQFFLIEDFLLQYQDDDSVDLTRLDPSIIIIPFLLHAVPIIWQQDKTYFVEKMDKDLYESLEKIKKIFKLFYPSRSWNGVLKARKLVENSFTQASEYSQNWNAVVIPFSGGVDSTYNSLAVIDKKQYLVGICGGDVPLANSKMWQEVKKHCQQYAQSYNVPFLSVKSNFAGIYNGAHEFTHPAIWTYMTQGLGYTSLMIPFMVSKGIPFCLIGSASVVDYPWPYGSHPLIEHNLKIAGCHSFHFGAELTRSKKIGNMLEVCKKYALPKPKLRVCWANKEGENCNKCFSKCIVTMVCLLVEGEDYKEFGFSLSFEELVARLKTYLTDKPLELETMYKWLFVQRRIKELKTQKIQYSSEVADFLVWLEALDLENFVDKNKSLQFSDSAKSIFSSLWSDSLEVARVRFQSYFA